MAWVAISFTIVIQAKSAAKLGNTQL